MIFYQSDESSSASPQEGGGEEEGGGQQGRRQQQDGERPHLNEGESYDKVWILNIQHNNYKQNDGLT